MPYKKQIARKRKTVISDNVRNFLLTGERAKGDVKVFKLAQSPKQIRAVWAAVRNDILPEFIRDNLCIRPYAFWIAEAPERRRKVAGSGDGWTPGTAMDSDGTPKYWQIDWDKNDGPCFESQALFLKRHGLLTTTEKQYLKEHKELLQPDQIYLMTV